MCPPSLQQAALGPPSETPGSRFSKQARGLHSWAGPAAPKRGPRDPQEPGSLAHQCLAPPAPSAWARSQALDQMTPAFELSQASSQVPHVPFPTASAWLPALVSASPVFTWNPGISLSHLL